MIPFFLSSSAFSSISGVKRQPMSPPSDAFSRHGLVGVGRANLHAEPFGTAPTNRGFRVQVCTPYMLWSAQAPSRTFPYVREGNATGRGGFREDYPPEGIGTFGRDEVRT